MILELAPQFVHDQILALSFSKRPQSTSQNKEYFLRPLFHFVDI
jgi:hypothetical protein